MHRLLVTLARYQRRTKCDVASAAVSLAIIGAAWSVMRCRTFLLAACWRACCRAPAVEGGNTRAENPPDVIPIVPIVPT